MDDENYMRMAIDKAREGVSEGQTPFGACIVKDDKVISCDHNRVWETTDITAHGEIVAIRRACLAIDNIKLTGATIYSTTEPCPMCFAAIHWAGIKRIVFGARIDDAEKHGFSELKISNEQMKELGDSDVNIIPDCLREENLELWRGWAESQGRTY